MSLSEAAEQHRAIAPRKSTSRSVLCITDAPPGWRQSATKWALTSTLSQVRGNIRLTLEKILGLLGLIFFIVGAAMRDAFRRLLTTAFFLGVAVSVNPHQAAAADLDTGLMSSGPGNCSEIVFTCENGREYPLCPIAVTVAGEVVTASLYTGPHAPTHVRLVPMGVGYRYAGPGIWLDGFGENALLNFGNHSQIACTIQHY
ncbi:MAG TPA: hypothetical protein VKS24_01060 [Bradyrhizobium sp.]|nr:hypothetical protein [Bradyrhizobium sp.]